eukprot:TRINITY_DN2891_c0_g1_i1.p1 TRINITY_DN2891_c0_g1~~TRINITY_DN2891_c0_g1_i1.p1  ORF type:complete len:454 (-),score=130.16 TRINITY_DN2891_c0_g1_i1:588-1754(-)
MSKLKATLMFEYGNNITPEYFRRHDYAMYFNVVPGLQVSHFDVLALHTGAEIDPEQLGYAMGSRDIQTQESPSSSSTHTSLNRTSSITSVTSENGDTDDLSCYLVFEITNNTNMAFESEFSIRNNVLDQGCDGPQGRRHTEFTYRSTISIESHSMRRIALPIQRFSLENSGFPIPEPYIPKGQFLITQHPQFTPSEKKMVDELRWYNAALQRLIEFHWSSSCNQHGRLYLQRSLTSNTIRLLTPGDVQLQIGMNGLNATQVKELCPESVLPFSVTNDMESSNVPRYYKTHEFCSMLVTVTTKQANDNIGLWITPFLEEAPGKRVFDLSHRMITVGGKLTEIALEANGSHTVEFKFCCLTPGLVKIHVVAQTEQGMVDRIVSVEAISVE